MKNTAKRVLSLLMTLVMLVSLLPVQAFADNSAETPPLLPPPSPGDQYPHLELGSVVTLLEGQSKTYYFEGNSINYPSYPDIVSIVEEGSGNTEYTSYKILTFTGKTLPDGQESASTESGGSFYVGGDSNWPYSWGNYSVQVQKNSDPTGKIFNGGTFELEEGKTRQLTAKAPSCGLEWWSSDNTLVAAVDESGLVTAVKAPVNYWHNHVIPITQTYCVADHSVSEEHKYASTVYNVRVTPKASNDDAGQKYTMTVRISGGDVIMTAPVSYEGSGTVTFEFEAGSWPKLAFKPKDAGYYVSSLTYDEIPLYFVRATDNSIDISNSYTHSDMTFDIVLSQDSCAMTVYHYLEGSSTLLSMDVVQCVPHHEYVAVGSELIDITGNHAGYDGMHIYTAGTGTDQIVMTHKRDEIGYIVHYYEENTTKRVALDKIAANMSYGAVFTETAITVEGYTALAPTTQTVAAGYLRYKNVAPNEIIFYYRAADPTPDPEYKVSYTYTKTPTDPLFDAAGNPAVIPEVPAGGTYKQGSTVAVDTTVAEGMKFDTRDAYGNVNGEWKFSGWSTEDAVIQSGSFTMPGKDAVLRGAWSFEKRDVPEWTVTYTDGAAEEVVFADEIYSKIPNKAPTPAFAGSTSRTGYTFTGWASSVENGIFDAAAIAQKAVISNVTYTAQWTPDSVTVTYHSNLDPDAVLKTDTVLVKDASDYRVSGPNQLPEYPGHTFLGWADTADSAAAYQNGDPLALPDSGNRDLYAVWAQKQYRIYYYDNTAPFPGISDDAQYASGEKATVLGGGSTIADASGLRYLMGWTDVPGAYILNTQAEINAFRSSHTTYAFDSEVQFADSDIKLYAYWGPTNPGADIYEVSYRVHNTVTGETFDYGTAEQHANGQEVTVRSKYPDVQTGWQVTDWKANGITPTNGKFTMVGRDVLFTAELSRIEYPVTYQITAPEAFKNDSYKQETHYYGDALTLISDDMEREGYTWSGWTGLPNTMPNEAVTVVGSYTVQQYTVTYKVDGEVYGAVETHNFGDALTLRAAPTRTGYTFSGWAPALPEKMPARNLEIVGSFKPIDYTLTYYVDGVKDGDSEVYHYEDPLTARTAPTRTGYTFSGWSPAVPEKMPANNLDVYGTFTINSYPYTVNYLLADSGEPVPGMQPTTGSQNYGTVYTAAYPEITGYVKAPAVDGRAEPDLQLQITEGSNVLNLYYYKTLTVTVADARKNYGVSDADAGLKATVDAAQLLRAADEAGIPKSPIVRTAGQTGENIGQYGIEVQGKAAPQIAGDYYVTYVPGTLTIDPVAVTVTMGTMEKTYGDADPTQAEGRAYVTVSDGLVGSDTIPYAWSRESGEDVKAGGYPVAIRLDANVPAPAAENAPIAYGNYLVTFVDGTMIIKPKVLDIETFDGSKVYDGTPLVGTGKLDPAIAGESVTASFTTLNSVAKDVPNAYSLTWGEGTKSSNYQIHEVKIGKLTMTDSTQQIRVDVTGGTFVYDGTVHGAQVTVTGLPAGYTLQTARSNAAARNVSDGTVTAVCDALVIVNAAQENVTDRLNVVYGEPAALTILPRDIVFQSANGAKQYDGTPLTAPTVTVGGQYGFVPGEEQGVTFQVTGSLVGNPNQAEEADNEFTWTFDPAILDAANYSIRKVVGRLLVDPLPMHRLTIHYVYADGTEAAADFTDLFRQGEQYQVYSPVIAGFTADAVFVRSGPEGMPNADVEVTVVYRLEAVPQPADPGVEIVPDETEAGYRLEDVEDDAVPLAGGAEDGGHVDCILHFLLMAAALIVQLVYMDKRKKYQERIFELKKQLGDTSMDEE